MSESKHTPEPNRNRPTTNPGGLECLTCGCIFIGDESHTECAVCYEETRRTHAALIACKGISTEALEAGVVAEMVVLLRKFAAEADQWADAVPDDYRSPCIEPGAKSAHPGSETVFTVGDTRKARALSALLIVAAEDADRRNAMKAVA